MRLLKLGLCVSIIAVAGCAQAQMEQPKDAEARVEAKPKTPAACQAAEYRQMDFWLGEWGLTWDNGDGTTGTGNNIISRKSHGDCVITENFNGAPSIPLKGQSLSTYSKPHRVWRQTWVDNQGGYFALTGGPQEDGTFILDMERLGGKGPFSRMVFEDIEKDSLVWRWQGKKLESDEWADIWVINYERK